MAIDRAMLQRMTRRARRAGSTISGRVGRPSPIRAMSAVCRAAPVTAPLAARPNETVRSAGVADAVSGHRHGAVGLAQATNGVDLLGRHEAGLHKVDAGLRDDDLGGRVIVHGQRDRRRDAERVAAAEHLRSPLADGAADGDDTEGAAAVDDDRRGASNLRLVERRVRARVVGRAEQLGPPDDAGGGPRSPGAARRGIAARPCPVAGSRSRRALSVSHVAASRLKQETDVVVVRRAEDHHALLPAVRTRRAAGSGRAVGRPPTTALSASRPVAWGRVAANQGSA